MRQVSASDVIAHGRACGRGVHIWSAPARGHVIQMDGPKINAETRATRGIRHARMHLRGGEHENSAWRRDYPDLRLEFHRFLRFGLHSRVLLDELGCILTAGAFPFCVIVSSGAVSNCLAPVARMKGHGVLRNDRIDRHPPIDLTHRRDWSQAVRNGSAGYNYAEWNRTSRQNAAQFVKQDTRVQPKPEEAMELEPQIRVIAPPGGILMFSAAQMHSSVPNTSGRTRFSIDFRTVHLDDVAARRGAPNVDSACTGTSMGDYIRGTDLAHIPEHYFPLYKTHPPFAKPEQFETAASAQARCDDARAQAR